MSNFTHPGAMGPVGRLWEMTKHVVGKAAKYGMVGMGLGAIPGGILSLGSIVATGPLGAVIGLAKGGLALFSGGSLIGSMGTAVAAALGTMALPLIISMVAVGAGLAAVGAVAGLFGAGKAAREAEEDRMANIDRTMAMEQRMQAMQMRQAQMNMAVMQQAAQSQGLGPNLGLPGGRGGRDLTA